MQDRKMEDQQQGEGAEMQDWNIWDQRKWDPANKRPRRNRCQVFTSRMQAVRRLTKRRGCDSIATALDVPTKYTQKYRL